MSPADVTLDELARWSGESPEDLGRWRDLGLLPEEGGASLAQRLERVRLIRFAIDRGFGPDRLAEITAAQGDLLGPFAQQIAALAGEPMLTAEEVFAKSDLDPALKERLWAASGLADEPYATEADMAAIGLLGAAVGGGFPPEALAQLVRVFYDASGRIADAASRLFHLYVHEQMRAGGTGGAALLAATNTMGEPLMGLAEPAVIYFHRKAWARALREDMALHLAEETSVPSTVPGEFTRAILFADLSSFTPLTEAMGDAAAAQVVGRFSELVRAGAARCSGQVIKQIGDEFMLVFANGAAAVSCGLAIQEQVAAEPRFPAVRIGAHLGSVLYREGDYVGTSVNLAARVTGAAGRNQFLVTEAVREQARGLEVEMVALGARGLKGLSEAVALFEVRRAGEPSAKLLDPVCGMELALGSVELRLTWQGEELVFCTDACLKRFVADPARYAEARQ